MFRMNTSLEPDPETSGGPAISLGGQMPQAAGHAASQGPLESVWRPFNNTTNLCRKAGSIVQKPPESIRTLLEGKGWQNVWGKWREAVCVWGSRLVPWRNVDQGCNWPTQFLTILTVMGKRELTAIQQVPWIKGPQNHQVQIPQRLAYGFLPCSLSEWSKSRFWKRQNMLGFDLGKTPLASYEKDLEASSGINV